MTFSRASAIFAMILLLTGAGCAPLKKIESTLAKLPWFRAPSGDAKAAAEAIALEPGLGITIRPSTFGVTGAVEEALGDESRVLRLTVREAAPETLLAMDWKSASATGTLTLAFYEDAQAMLLPAFWPAGEAEARHNGAIWMSHAAFASLKNDQAVEWRLGLADQTLSVISKAFKAFNDLSIRFAGSATSTPVSPFQLRKTGTSDSFPLLVNDKLTFVRILRATSWFGDVFILDNPENPLIVKVVVHSAAQPALRALEPTSVRWNEIGYEITSLFRP